MPVEQNRATSIKFDGIDYTYFGGTNYLSLSHRSELITAGEAAFREYGFSAGASRLTSGESDLLLELEQELANFAVAEKSIVLPAGYMSNSAVVEALDDIVDCWFALPQAHGSISTALSITRKRVIVHDGDTDIPLREAHGLAPQTRLALFAEPISALDGAVADLTSLQKLLEADDFLILDESHSFGVLGETGRGAKERFSLHRENLVRTGTFSKAVGTYGGFVVATNDLIERIKKYSQSFRASTALSPVVVAATRAALLVLSSDCETCVGRLRANILAMNAALCELGVERYAHNEVPIYYLQKRSGMENLVQELRAHGLFLPAVGTYFSNAREIGVRWTVQAGHTVEDFELLMRQLRTSVHSPG